MSGNNKLQDCDCLNPDWPGKDLFDIDVIKKVHLFGIPLYDAEGNPFPDELLQTYVDSAIAWAEKALNIAIIPRVEEEKHDYFSTDYMNWGFLKLNKKPVICIESLEMYYGDRPMMSIPKDWLRIDHLAGHVQLFPTAGSAGGIIITSGGGLVTPMLRGSYQYAPQMWKVKYKAGMVKPNGQVYRGFNLHPDLLEAIYKKAAMSIMTVWGDLIIGAGIANQSISIDGMSQSIGTTQSAMYGGASARVEQLKKDVDNLMKTLNAYYNGIEMVVV